jgi:hypothetical protein
MIIAKNFFTSCNESVFHCAHTELGVRRPSYFFLIIFCVAYRLVSSWINLNISGLKNISNISMGELF